MRWKLVIIGVVALALGTTIYVWKAGQLPPPLGRSIKTEDDPVSAEAGSVDLVNAADFQFTWGDGSGMYGYDVVKVTADGRVTYTFADPPNNATKWKYAAFTLDAQTMTDLRKLLVGMDYFRLKKVYYDAGLADGTQRFVKVIASGKRKSVYCSNYFPSPVCDVQGFVEVRIIQPHSSEIAAAQQVQIDRKNMESESFDR